MLRTTADHTTSKRAVQYCTQFSVWKINRKKNKNSLWKTLSVISRKCLKSHTLAGAGVYCGPSRLISHWKASRLSRQGILLKLGHVILFPKVNFTPSFSFVQLPERSLKLWILLHHSEKVVGVVCHLPLYNFVVTRLALAAVTDKEPAFTAWLETLTIKI